MSQYKRKFVEIMAKEQAYRGLYEEISFLENKGYSEEDISKEVARQIYEALENIERESDKTKNLIRSISTGIIKKLRVFL